MATERKSLVRQIRHKIANDPHLNPSHIANRKIILQRPENNVFYSIIPKKQLKRVTMN